MVQNVNGPKVCRAEGTLLCPQPASPRSLGRLPEVLCAPTSNTSSPLLPQMARRTTQLRTGTFSTCKFEDYSIAALLLGPHSILFYKFIYHVSPCVMCTLAHIFEGKIRMRVRRGHTNPEYDAHKTAGASYTTKCSFQRARF